MCTIKSRYKVADRNRVDDFVTFAYVSIGLNT